MSQRRPIAKAAFIPRPATSKSFTSVNPAGFKNLKNTINVTQSGKTCFHYDVVVSANKIIYNIGKKLYLLHQHQESGLVLREYVESFHALELHCNRFLK